MASAASRRVTSPVMVGRHDELATVRRAIEGIADGRPHVVIIGGEGGAGKTRLVDEAMAWAGEDLRALRGDCLAFGTRIPYLPFAQMLRELLHELPGPEIGRIVQPAREELARFMPEIAEAVGKRGGIPIGRAGDLERLRLLEGLLRVAERIAQDRPTAFIVEDAQWIDGASLELLAFLAHSMRQGRVLLVITVRTEALEADSAILGLVADLERGPGVDRLELGPLDAEDARRQIASIAGDDFPREEADRIWTLSDGNPFLVEELVAAALDGGGDGLASPRLRDLLDARIGRLAPDVQAILAVAAVAGRATDLEILAAVSGQDPQAVQRAVAAAVDEHILVRARDRTRGYRFRHELVRAALADRIAPADSRSIHAAYASALEGDAVARRDPSEIAAHWDAAEVAERALPAHVEAGLAVEQRFAHDAAAHHYERAIALWGDVEDAAGLAGHSRARILQLAAAARARAGDHAAAVDLARRLLREEREADADLLELVRSSLRWYLWHGGRTDEATDEARAAVRRLRREPATRWSANAQAHLAGLLLGADRVADARSHAEAAFAIAREIDARDERILAGGIIGWCLVLEGRLEAGIERIRESVSAAREAEAAALGSPVDRFDERPFPVGHVLALTQLATVLELAGRAEAAALAATEAYALASDQGVGRTYGATLQAIGARALLRLGRWEEARAAIETALRDGAQGSGRIGLLAARALIEVGRGDEAAGRTMAEAEADLDGSTAAGSLRWLRLARAEQLLWQRQPFDALAVIAEIAEPGGGAPGGGTGAGRVVDLDASLPRLLALAARSAADIAVHERAGGIERMASERAIERVRGELRRLRRRAGLMEAWAVDIALVRAELARASGAFARTTIARWESAADAAREEPQTEAYARWRLAGALFGDRTLRDRGAAELERARRLAASVAAGPLRSAIDELAARAGLPAEADSPGGGASEARPFGLTARELEVLGLVATGLGNHAIAERLFISPKTASVHVSNIYGKLGVESRVAAATIAHDLGIVARSEPTGDLAAGDDR